MLLIPLSLLFHLSEPDISNEKPVLPTVATFSIVGYDAETESPWNCCAIQIFLPLVRLYRGQRQAWARSQPNLGQIRVMAPNGLKLLKSGLSAKQTLERLIADDPGRATRQIGIVDAKGNVANYTGDECNAWAGAVSGKYYTAQGNILAGEAVVKAMGRAFEETEGELADKLMAALFAGQEAGGRYTRTAVSSFACCARKAWLWRF